MSGIRLVMFVPLVGWLVDGGNASAANLWKSSIKVFKKEKNGTWSKDVGRVRRFRTQNKNKRQWFPHLPIPNGTLFGRDRGSLANDGSVVLLDKPGRKHTGEKSVVVHEKDTIAIPVHTSNVTFGLKGMSLVGLTDRVKKTGGKHSKMRLLLFRPSQFSEGGRVSVREGNGKIRRYEVKLDESQINIHHEVRNGNWYAHSPKVIGGH